MYTFGDLGLKGLAVVVDIEVKIVKIGPTFSRSVFKLEQKLKREKLAHIWGFEVVEVNR